MSMMLRRQMMESGGAIQTDIKWAYEDKVYNITSPFDLKTQNGMGITESFTATTGEIFRCYYTNPDSISMGGYNKLWALDSSLNRINYKSLGNSAGTEVRVQATIDDAVSCAQFTIPLAGADDDYIYRESTGEIIYAGKNSIYYGHRNISEVSA